MNIVKFNDDMQEQVNDFFEKCFAAVGIPYSPKDRHADVANVESHYMNNGCFWCLIDDNNVIGTQQEYNSEKEAKQKCKEMKEDIVSRMNKLYREVDPQGRTFFDDIFTKRDETYSGSEEQEYYYSRVLAINDYFNHSYPLLIDCYKSGEISSQKEDIMIKKFITRKKQVIITSTLKEEEYTAQKYDQYKGDANVIDYSDNESSKLLQPLYVGRLGAIVESFGVMFTEE